jgi:hypothetical protein
MSSAAASDHGGGDAASKKSEEHRRLVSQEVASTELSYVGQLLMAKQLFLQPALKVVDSASPLLTADEIAILFGNLEPLLKHANELCKQVCRSIIDGRSRGSEQRQRQPHLPTIALSSEHTNI